jgi:hypothetical protein
LAGTTPQSGQLRDPVARFGDRADGGLLERLVNEVAIGGQFTHLAFDVPTPEPVQAPVSECGHIPLDGSPSDPGDFGGFLTCESTVQQPKDQHFLPNPRMGMRGPFLIHEGLLLRGQLHAKPSHNAPCCVPTRGESVS